MFGARAMGVVALGSFTTLFTSDDANRPWSMEKQQKAKAQTAASFNRIECSVSDKDARYFAI